MKLSRLLSSRGSKPSVVPCWFAAACLALGPVVPAMHGAEKIVGASLNSAITEATDGDVLILQADVTQVSTITLDRVLTIRGDGTTPMTITAPAGNTRLFSIPNGGAFYFENVVLRGNETGTSQIGMGLNVAGANVLENGNVKATTIGGSFSVAGFRTAGGSNYGAVYGGTTNSILKLGSPGGTVTVSDNFAGNGAGAGVRGHHLIFDANMVLARNITAGTAGGGGVYAGGNVTFNGAASILANEATNTTAAAGTHGAGVFASGTVTFNGATLIENNIAANGNGAGVRSATNVVFEGPAILRGNEARRGTSTSASGGAVWTGTDLTINGAMIATDNLAATNGGALAISNGQLTVGAGSTFERNQAAAGAGGAIYIAAPTAAKTHRFNATTGDILFRDNIANGARNALHVSLAAGVGQSIDFLADANRTIWFYDPITSPTTALATVTKRGQGTLYFDTFETTLHANTTVAAGTLHVANNAIYGSSAAGGSVAVADGATLSGNGTVRATDISLANGSTVRVTDGGTLTLAGAVSGDGVNLAGRGTLDTTNAVNSATITAENGTLTLARATTLAGTLSATGNGGTIAANEGIALSGSAILVANDGQQLEVSATLSGAGASLVKNGAGNATLSAANTYDGGTTIAAGSLTVTNAGALGAGAVANQSKLVTALATDGTIANAISGSGSLTQNGAGTTTLTGANTFTGATTVASGTLRVGSDAAATGIAQSSGVVLADHATAALDLAGRSATISSLTGGGANGGQVKLGNGQLTINAAASANPQVYAGSVSGAAGSALVKSGAGTLELSGPQPLATGFAGNVAVNQGALNVTGGTLATTGAFTVGDDATLGLAAGTGLIQAGSVDFGVNSLINITGYNASNLGAVALIQSATAITDAAQAGLRFNGQTITPSLDQYLALELSLSGDARTLSLVSDLAWNSQAAAHGTFNIGADASFTTPTALANNTTFTGALGNWDGRTLTKTGSGTLIFNHANSYTGATLVQDGTLRLEAANAIATSANVAVSADASLEVAGANQSLNNLSGAGEVVLAGANATVNSTTATTLSGIVSGNGALVKSGAETLTLSGANTYSGGTTISAGRLVATHGGALGTGGTVNNAALEFATTGDSAYAGTLSGNGSLTKSGAGALTLTAATASAGAIDVNGGTLAVGDGAQATAFTATSANVASGAALTVERDSSLALSGALGVANNGTLNLVVGSNAPVISAASATIGTTGTTLNVGGISGTTSMPFTLISTTSGITGDFAAVNVGGSGNSATDYLVVSAAKAGNNYVVNTALRWSTPGANPNGTFTLTDASETFDLGVALTNQAANADTGWDGRSLTKAGAGMLTLSAVNTYTGATNVTGGTLRFGVANAIATSSAVFVADGATLDLNGQNQSLNELSGAGDIALGSATLTAVNNTNSTLSGVISGSGRFVKQGSGTLTLSGANTYSGGTTVSGGRLSVTALNALGAGNITNNAAVEFGAGATGTFEGVITGNGTITKLGTGALAFTGNSAAFTGSTSIQGGLFTVNGTLGGALTIGSGARLQGTGSLGSTTIASGGTFAPGNSIGTTTVTGNLTFAAGSTYEVEMDVTGATDRVNVTGTATIQSGASVNVLKAAGNYAPLYGQRYTIINAAGGVNGNFTSLTQNLPLIDMLVEVDANNVYLTLSRNRVAFDVFARTPNERGVASTIETFGHLHPLYRAVTDLADEASIATAFRHLSGELHASVVGALLDDSRLLRDAAYGRTGLLTAPSVQQGGMPSGSALWIQTVGGAGNLDGDGVTHAIERSKFGVLAGIDGAMLGNWRGGLLMGITRGSVDSVALSSTSDISSVHVGGYTSLQVDRFGLRGGVGYSRNFMDVEREVVFSGFTDRTSVRRAATTMQAFAEASWLFRFERGGVEPFVNGTVLSVESDEFSEHGGDSALAGVSDKEAARLGSAGVRGSYDLLASKLRLTGSVGWQRAFGDRAVRQALTFVNGTAPASYSVSGAPMSRDLLAVDAAAAFFFNHATRFDIGYSGQLGSAKEDHALRATLTRSF